ncbi:PH domain-containing rcdII isoform X2 [Octopus sinensis]|uniref:PH domain-containing rcdII isoform X2 n=1 Tax=Octopus sinensis TaxID=2607531 RepID=A0A6P7SNN6_9MOLL|nr:PH domain-containing rcdII isoform X2 [Octopus sinensis]
MKGDAGDHNMINLLSDSANDSQEILTLPPLKSKRSKLFGKKKKTQFEEPPCNPCRNVKYFIAILALAGLIAVALVTFILLHQVENLKKEFESVERKNQFTPEEFQRLHTQIQELNKTLNNYKSGKNGLQAILYNVTLLTKEIATLKENSASLQKSLDKAPSLESLPTEVETISKNLRSQGSDLAAFKTQVEQEFQVDSASFENITASMKEMRADIKQLQIEKGHADNFTYDFTRLTTQFQEDLNSTEVKLKDQILQLQKQFYIFESQLNETTTAANNTTTTTTSTDVTTSTTNPPTNSIPSSTGSTKAATKK